MTDVTVTHDGPGEPRVVSHEQPDKPYEVTVTEANVLQGMERNMLISESRIMARQQARKAKGEPEAGEEEEEEETVPLDLPEGKELAIFLVRRYTWPNCKAASVAAKGFDLRTLTFEDFVLLPEAFVIDWENAVLELNPHWRLGLVGTKKEDKAEKKDKEASAEE